LDWRTNDDRIWRSFDRRGNQPSDTEEVTLWSQLPPLPLSSSFYLRRKLRIADPQAVKWLVLRMDYTYGFVAYLSGQVSSSHTVEMPAKYVLRMLPCRNAE